MATKVGAAIGIGLRIGRDLLVVLLLLAILGQLDAIYELVKVQTLIMLGASSQPPLPEYDNQEAHNR